jgi:hypothetical protein
MHPTREAIPDDGPHYGQEYDGPDLLEPAITVAPEVFTQDVKHS